MFGLGMSEIILLSVMALIIIGPKQLPEVARTLGRFINDLKRSTEGLKDEIKRQAMGDLEIEDYLRERKKNEENALAQPTEPQQIELQPIQSEQNEIKDKKDEPT